MKVLQVVHAYPPAKGGSEYLAQQIAQRLVRDFEDEVTVMTTVANGTSYFGSAAHSLPAGIEKKNGVTIHRLPVIHQGRWLRRLLSTLTYRLHLPGNDYWRTLYLGPIMPGLAKQVASSQADVILANAFPLQHMYDTLKGARRGQIPLVYWGALHLNDHWGYDRPMIYHAIRQATGYIAHTEIERDFVVAKGTDPAKISVIGAGVDLAPFLQADGALMRRQLGLGNDPTILAVGKHGPRKRFDIMIEAMRPIWEVVPTARLLIGGESNGYTDLLLERVAALPAEWRSRIAFVNDFSEEEKASLFAACDLFVLPSAEESFGIVLLEAWACGKPVIGVDVGAVSSIIDNGVDGLHFHYPQAESLATACIALLSHPERAAHMGQAGLAKVRAHFTWDKVVAQVRATLQEKASNFS